MHRRLSSTSSGSTEAPAVVFSFRVDKVDGAGDAGEGRPPSAASSKSSLAARRKLRNGGPALQISVSSSGEDMTIRTAAARMNKCLGILSKAFVERSDGDLQFVADWLRTLDQNLFKELEPNAMKEFAAEVCVVSVPAGQIVFRQGESSDSMFLILKGSVSVWIINEQSDMQYPTHIQERHKQKKQEAEQAKLAAAAAASGGASGGAPSVTPTPSGSAVASVGEQAPSDSVADDQSDAQSQSGIEPDSPYSPMEPSTPTTPMSPNTPFNGTDNRRLSVTSSSGKNTGRKSFSIQQLTQKPVAGVRQYVSTLKAGTATSAFGELGLVTGKARSATVKAEEDTFLLKIDKDIFDRYLKLRYETELKERVKLLKQFDILKSLHSGHLKQIADYFERRRVGANQVILKQGDPAKQLYFLSSGQCVLKKRMPVELQPSSKGGLPKKLYREYALATLCGGELFGDTATLSDPPMKRHPYEVVTVSSCEYFVINKDDFIRRIRTDLLYAQRNRIKQKRKWRAERLRDAMGDQAVIRKVDQFVNPAVVKYMAWYAGADARSPRPYYIPPASVLEYHAAQAERGGSPEGASTGAMLNMSSYQPPLHPCVPPHLSHRPRVSFPVRVALGMKRQIEAEHAEGLPQQAVLEDALETLGLEDLIGTEETEHETEIDSKPREIECVQPQVPVVPSLNLPLSTRREYALEQVASTVTYTSPRPPSAHATADRTFITQHSQLGESTVDGGEAVAEVENREGSPKQRTDVHLPVLPLWLVPQEEGMQQTTNRPDISSRVPTQKNRTPSACRSARAAVLAALRTSRVASAATLAGHFTARSSDYTRTRSVHSTAEARRQELPALRKSVSSALKADDKLGKQLDQKLQKHLKRQERQKEKMLGEIGNYGMSADSAYELLRGRNLS